MMEIAHRFAFRQRFHLAPHRFYNPIEVFSGCLYPQSRHISREACAKLPRNEIRNIVKIPLIWSIVGLFGRLKIPFRD